MNDDELLDALGDALEAPDREVPAERIAALRAQAAASPSTVTGLPSPRRRTLLVGTIAASVGALAGAAGTVLATGGSGEGEGKDEAAGPPTQPVEFDPVPEGTTVAGRTIDHTWGMELLLDVAGLPVDRTYAVTFATADGRVAAGGFRSVAVEMHCRFNATALRADVTEVAIADEATGDVVLRGRPA